MDDAAMDSVRLVEQSQMPFSGYASVSDQCSVAAHKLEDWRSRPWWSLMYHTPVVEAEYCVYVNHIRRTVFVYSIASTATVVGGTVMVTVVLRSFHNIIFFFAVGFMVAVFAMLGMRFIQQKQVALLREWRDMLVLHSTVPLLEDSRRVPLQRNARWHEFWCVFFIFPTIVFNIGLQATRIECQGLQGTSHWAKCLETLHGTGWFLYGLALYNLLVPVRFLFFAASSLTALVLLVVARFIPQFVLVPIGNEAFLAFLCSSAIGLFCVILPAAYLRERSSRLDFENVVERFMRMEESKRLRERLQATTQGDVPPRLANGVHDRDGLFGWCPEGIVCGVALSHHQHSSMSTLGPREIIWLTHAVCRLLDGMRLTLKTSCYRYRAEGDHFLMATGESGSLGEIVAFVTKAVASILVHPELRRVLPPDRTRTSLHGVVGAVARGPFAGLFLRSSRQYTLLGNPARAVTAALGKHVPLDVAALVTVLDNAPELERDLVIPSDATPDTLPDFYAADELRSLSPNATSSGRRSTAKPSLQRSTATTDGTTNSVCNPLDISSQADGNSAFGILTAAPSSRSTELVLLNEDLLSIRMVFEQDHYTLQDQLTSNRSLTREDVALTATEQSPSSAVTMATADGNECSDPPDSFVDLVLHVKEFAIERVCGLLTPFAWRFVSPDIEAQYAAHSVAAFDLPRVVLLWIAAAALTASAISAVAIEYGGQRPNGVILASIGPVVIAGFALVLESRTRWLFVALDLLHTVLFSVGITFGVSYGEGAGGIDLTLWFMLYLVKTLCAPAWHGPLLTALPICCVMAYFAAVALFAAENHNALTKVSTPLIALFSVPFTVYRNFLMDKARRLNFTILLQVDAMKTALDADYERLKEALAQLAPHGVAAQMTQRARLRIEPDIPFTTTTFGTSFLVIDLSATALASPHLRRAAAGIQAVHAKVGQQVREVEEGTLAVQATSMRVVVVATRSGTESEEEMALRVLEFAMRARQTLSDVEGLQMLVHSGYVTGAVIGLTSLTFQYFGPAFVVADQILQNAPVGPGALMVTARTVKMLAAEWGQPTTEVGCTVGHCVPFSAGDGSDASHECALVCQGMWRVRGSAGLGMYILQTDIADICFSGEILGFRCL